MTSRIQNAVQPDVTTGIQHLFKAVYAGRRACVDAGVKSATKAGVSPEELLTVAAWYENPLLDLGLHHRNG